MLEELVRLDGTCDMTVAQLHPCFIDSGASS